MNRFLKRFLLLACMAVNCASAKLVIHKTLCNYQTEPMAIVDSKEKIRIGWQYTDDQKTLAIQEAYHIIVTERHTRRIVYDRQVATDQSQFIELPHLKYNTFGYQWKVRISQGGIFSDWSEEQTIRVMPEMKSPTWIGAITKKDAHIPEGRWSNTEFKSDAFKSQWVNVDTLSAKSIVLRKNCLFQKRIIDAIVYICGLGHYEFYINGSKIGDSAFAPLWSEYSKTVYYNVHDVTTALERSGPNEFAVLLGNGFFNVQRDGRYSKLQTSFGPPQLFFRMDITYEDGSKEQIVSDESWKWELSPITFNSIYGGESYDARLETNPQWKPVVITEGPGGILRPETCQPVRIMEHYNVASWNPATSVADMGQNLAGFPEITVSGQRGQKVKLLVAERLTPQGTCDQSQTGRPHYYEYTLKGESQELWHPRFSYYGFRYIQIEGAVMEGQPNPDKLPVIHCLRSCFVYNSAAETSSFWCNDERFTKTHRLIERAERSNMQAVMTDCPHREKLGWLEQDHLCGPSLFYNYDMTRLVPKIIRDIVDSQKPNGMVPTTAPQYVSFGNLFDDSPEWGSTLIILPFQYYDMYGDSTLIIDNYVPMRRYVDYLTSRAEDGIVSHGLGDWYDYGPGKAGFSKNTPVPLVATAHYIYDLQLITEAAQMTGRQADAKKYNALYHKVVESFNRHFYKPDSCYYGSGSQTSNALPLFLGICGENKAAVLQSLVNDIHAHGDRLTTGDIGNRYLFRVLADNDQNALLYKMLNHEDTPGYGFQIAQGATTLTEQWDPREGASENHFMLGQIDEWLFRSLSGIRQKPGTHGMRHLIVDPQPDCGITNVRTTIHTLYGEVKVDKRWGIPTDSNLTVTIPGGCDVQIRRPGEITVHEGESLHDALRQAREWRRTNDKRACDGIVINVKAGRYYMQEPLFIRPEDSGTDKAPLLIRGEAGAILCGDPRQEHTQLWPEEGMAQMLGFESETRTITIPTPPNIDDLRQCESLEMVVHQRWAIAILRVKDMQVEGDRTIVTFMEPESRLEFEHPWPQPVIGGEKGNSSFLLRTTEQRDGIEQLLVIDGAKLVTIEGLTFENTCWNRPLHKGHVTLQGGFPLIDAYKLKEHEGLPWDEGLENQAWIERPVSAVTVRHAEGIIFERCVFRHLGATALDIESIEGCDITRCTFDDIGGTAILAGSFAESPREVHRPYTDLAAQCHDIAICNNIITHASQEDWGAVGIGCGYVSDCLIKGNDVSHLNYSGICVGWGWTPHDTGMHGNAIAENRITDYARQLYDAGGIYTLSYQPGSTIRRNEISAPTVAPYATNNRAFRIYLDARTDGFSIIGNATGTSGKSGEDPHPIRRNEIGDNHPGPNLIFEE